MGQFKDVGDAALALAEECAEVIQVIAKMKRFEQDNWDEIPPGQMKSRWELLKYEMDDVMYQWDRLKLSLSEPEYDSAGFTEQDR